MEALISRMTARLLLDVGAVRVSTGEPFKLASGNFSPIYIDCRALLSDAPAMDLVSAFIHWTVDRQKLAFDVVAGGESAGIPFAAQVAARLARPTGYVRKGTKGYGTKTLVEGSIPAGSRVLLVEDLVTDGGSKLGFVESLRDAGMQVEDCIVIFDRLQGGAQLMASKSVRLHALTDLHQALNAGKECGIITEESLCSVQSYLSDPKGWHDTRSLPYIER